jgi:gliding motility-associated-like protein
MLIFAIICSVLVSNQATASHAVGADFAYECLGNNRYLVRLTLYRDCSGATLPRGPNAFVNIGARSNSCNFTMNAQRLNWQSTTILTLTCATQTLNRCNGGSLPGFEEYVYEGIVTMPRDCPDWTFSYSLCCRNGAITNLQNPSSRNIYVEATLNNMPGICNNSPVFTTKPVNFYCTGNNTFYNHGGIDIDGDSLVYTLIPPRHAANANIAYRFGLNANNPLQTTGPFQFDSNTGQMTFTPSNNQNSVVTVRVDEYRKGVLIGSTLRDIQMVVNACPNNATPTMSGINGTGAAFNGQTAVFRDTLCGSSQICFDILFQDPNVNDRLNASANNLPSGATFTVSNTQPPVAEFCWTPSPSDTGLFTFVVLLDDGVCPIPASISQSFSVLVSPSVYNITSNVVAPTCGGGADGFASVSISAGAIPPVTYLWSSGTAGPVLNNAQAGNYNVTITDNTGCSRVQAVVIPEPPAMVLTTATTPSVCNGNADGTATVTVTGGTSVNGTYAYEWSVANQVNTNPIITNLGSGNYNVTVTDDNGCTATTNAFVFQPGPLVINLSAASVSNYNGSVISCYGANDGIVAATANGGTLPYVYDWSPNANGQNTDTISNLGPGTYLITVTDDNGCNTGTSVTIAEPDSVTASVVVFSNYNGADISCFGANDGSARVTASGGTGALSYAWSAAANNQTTRTATNLGPGTYTVTVSDLNNCSSTGTVTLTEPDLLVATTYPTVDINGYQLTCFGANDGSAGVNASGGTPSYSYVWTDPNAQNTPVALDLVAGNYGVLVTDINGCTANSTITLNQPPQLTVTAAATSNYNGFNVSCSGIDDGEATAFPAGGVPPYSYVWNDPNAQDAQTATNLNANIPYTVIVSDTNECSIAVTVTLTEPTPVTTSTTVISDYNGRQISCFDGADGAASVLAGGGAPPYTFQWAPTIGGSSAAAIYNLSRGTYTVTVSDANNCQKIDSVSLIDPPALEAVAANLRDASCFGFDDAAAYVTPAGGTAGYSYQWDFNAGTQLTDTARNLAAGTYNVTITDINNCETVETVSVNEPTEVTSTTSKTDVLCFGDADGTAEVVANGGTPNYAFAWSTTPAQFTQQAVGLAPGTYSVVVTDDNGCTTTNSIEVTQPTALTIETGKTDPTCYGYTDGIAWVSVNGGSPNYTYNWNGTPGPEQAIDIAAGVYVMNAVDSNGCEIVDTIELIDPPTTAIEILPDSSLIPLGGQIRLNTAIITSANASVTYFWEPLDGLSCYDCPSPTANPLYTTTYTVEMTDANGCKTSAEAVVDVNDKTKLYYIPNAFSPNGDGYNDVFYVYGKAITNIKLLIFDRWGAQVFESNDLGFGWDGLYKGSDAQSSVFVYYVELYFENGDRVEEKGSITLLR